MFPGSFRAPALATNLQMSVPQRYTVTRREPSLETSSLGRVVHEEFYTDVNTSFVY